ncbi:uncharacterized protein LOC121330071 [Polyodon spathula]|uniref:uncharacterized protein LOC121330071 n=1 Tax=Polyodon spathula TaxID=7913 RepID=UPI001B7E98B7|nr:uncharacterized protein LOC121330071 [Polyodon spathula]
MNNRKGSVGMKVGHHHVTLVYGISQAVDNRKGRVAMKVGHHHMMPVYGMSQAVDNAAVEIKDIQEECRCGDIFEQSAQMNETEEFPKAINIPSRFHSSVVPLPLLKSKRLTVQDSDSEDDVAVSLKKSICAPGNSRAQVSELKPFADLTEREMQKKTDAERQRNKRRLREKQRQSQKTDLGEMGMSQRPKADTRETNNKSTKKDEASRRKKNRKDKELAAWKRAQAQIESLLDSQPGTVDARFRNMKAPQAFPWKSTRVQDLSHRVPQMEFNSYGVPPVTAYPTRNGEWPWMNPPQAAFRGPLPYPWQTGPLPNTRHNAEFMRCVQNPFQSLYNHPVPYSQDQSFIFSQYSDLPGSMQDDGDEARGSESKSTESNSPQSNQGTQTQTLSMNTETTYHPGLPVLSPGSGHYLQLLMSLTSQPTDLAAIQVGSRGEVLNKNGSQTSPTGQFSEGHEQSRERSKKT